MNDLDSSTDEKRKKQKCDVLDQIADFTGETRATMKIYLYQDLCQCTRVLAAMAFFVQIEVMSVVANIFRH